MKYFFPRKTDIEPFLVFDCVGKSEKDLNNRIKHIKAEDRHLIIASENIPKIINGICELDLIDNKYVVRNSMEFELAKTKLDTHNRKIELDKIDKGLVFDYFTFDNNIFSISSNAQMNWNRISLLYLMNNSLPNQEISTYDNKTYLLRSSEIPNFILSLHEHISNIISDVRVKKNKIK